MKNLIAIFVLLLTSTLRSQAQDIDLNLLHVQDSSMLNVNSPVREGCDVSIVGRNNPLFVHRTGTAFYTTTFLPAIYGKTTPSLSGRNVGIYGEACHDDVNTNSNNIGVMGCATGNDMGSSFGVMGYLDYKNGAAVYGSTGTKYGTTLHGRYAGFFRGPVRIIGSLEASSILGNSASGNSVSTYQTFDATEQNINQSVSQSLSNITSYTYSLAAPVQTASIEDLNSDGGEECVTEFEEEYYSRPHHGLSAEEVEYVYPELVYELSDGSKKINYIELIPILLQAINDLQAEVNELKGVRSPSRPMMAPVNTTTGINHATVDESSSSTYDLQGRRTVNSTTQGMVIRDGQKTIVK